MMDSKQLALVYLMDECNRMASVCTKNVHSLDKKKAEKALEQQIGVVFSALKEVAEEFKLDESNVEKSAMEEYNRRQNDRQEYHISWEQIAVGLQLVAIIAVVIGACIGPLLYTMYKDRNK